MASSIVKSTAEKLGTLLVDEAKSLYKVRDKIESLQAELEWVECFLRDADTQQHQDRIVSKWVSQVRDFAYDGEDIIETYLHGISHHRQDGIWNTLKWFPRILFTCDAWTLHNMGSEIDALTTKMSELSSRLRRYGIQVIRPTRSLEYNTLIREERRTHSHTEEDVVGMTKDIQEVVDQLVKIDVKVVAISGTGGLGKTTLARKVFKHKVIRDYFNDNCVWIYISKEFDSKNIFQEIIFGLEKDDEKRKKIKELPIEGLLTKIHELLLKQKCLVVLDDMWTEKAWERLKPAFESMLKNGSPSKIFFTTRNQGLLQHVDQSGYLHLLRPLHLDDSWELLKRKAFLGVQGSSDDDQVKREGEMEKLGKEMLKHCGGLSIAIVTVGGILSTKKTVFEWKDVHKNISSYLMNDMEQEGTSSQISEILELSYNELPFYLKSCFLYLGNFPEDYEISTHRLYHLWEAEGFLAIEGGAKKRGGTSYDIGERYLNELVQRSMIQVGKCWASGKIKTCQVHDVLRDMCLRKCEEVSFLSHVEQTESGMARVLAPFSTEIKKLRRCAIHGEDNFHMRFMFGEKAMGLRSLLVFNSFSRPRRKLWKSIPLLRVLDLEGVDNYNEPQIFEQLIHLRYLSLRYFYLDEPSACIFDLQYLETLDLRCRGDRTMTRNDLSKMKRLKHLYLPATMRVKGDKKLMFPTGGQMETIKNFDPKRCETKELMQMTNLRVFSITKGYIFEDMEELNRVLEAPVMNKEGQLINDFCIRIHENVIKEDPLVLCPVAHHPNFKELRLDGPQKVDDIKNTNGVIFPNCLKRLMLWNSKTIGNEDLFLRLGKLPFLQVLEVRLSVIGGEGGGNKMSFSVGSFPHLRDLYITLPKGSFEWNLEEAAAPNLQHLVLNDCENLNKLENIPNSLTEVEFMWCRVTGGEVSTLEKLPHLKSLRVIGGLEEIKILSFSAGSFPQLTNLILKEQSELEEWEIGEGALANLQSLGLHDWHKLKKVVNKLPNSLTHVELHNCETGEGDVSSFDYLEKLPQLQVLSVNNDETGGGGSIAKKMMRFSPGSFPQLRELTLKQPKSEELEVGDDALSHLQILSLYDCLKLEKLNNLPDSLTKVNYYRIGEVLLLNCLGKLPHLQELCISEMKMAGGGSKLSFSPGSFPQLTQLKLFGLITQDWGWEWELEFGEGSLSNLQLLELEQCHGLKKLPEGLPDSVHIKCREPCMKAREIKYHSFPYFKHRGSKRADWTDWAYLNWVHPDCA